METTQTTAERAGTRAEFPKPLVRLRPIAGGYDAEVKMVASAEAEEAATGEGYQVVEVPERGPDFQEYPKYVFAEDGRREVVYTKDEAEQLEGFSDTPPPPKDPVEEGVPVPVAAAAMGASPNRPPIPADRG
jgi:hypothetical protein